MPGFAGQNTATEPATAEMAISAAAAKVKAVLIIVELRNPVALRWHLDRGGPGGEL